MGGNPGNRSFRAGKISCSWDFTDFNGFHENLMGVLMATGDVADMAGWESPELARSVAERISKYRNKSKTHGKTLGKFIWKIWMIPIP